MTPGAKERGIGTLVSESVFWKYVEGVGTLLKAWRNRAIMRENAYEKRLLGRLRPINTLSIHPRTRSEATLNSIRAVPFPHKISVATRPDFATTSSAWVCGEGDKKMTIPAVV